MSGAPVYPYGVQHRRGLLRLWTAQVAIGLQAWRDRKVAPIDAAADCCFVVGCGNSGTTLVASRLGNHPLVRLIPAETNLFEPRRSLARARARFLRETEAAQADGKTLLLEKTPKHVHSVARIRRILPRARFVALVRNPLDTCLSLKLRVAGRNWGGLHYAIERWLIDTGAVLRLQGDPGVLTLRYEALTEAPEQGFRALTGFVGLPWDATILDSADSAYARVTQHTGTMRLRAEQVRHPIRPNSGNWRSGLSPPEIAEVRSRTAALWQSLGGDPEGDGYRDQGVSDDWSSR